MHGSDTSFTVCEREPKGWRLMSACARWGGKRRSPTPNNAQHAAPPFRNKECFRWLVDLFSIPACRRPELIMGISSVIFGEPSPNRWVQDVIEQELCSFPSRVYLWEICCSIIETGGLGRSRFAPLARMGVRVGGTGGVRVMKEVRFGWGRTADRSGCSLKPRRDPLTSRLGK